MICVVLQGAADASGIHLEFTHTNMYLYITIT
jgi:hypothetical protein